MLNVVARVEYYHLQNNKKANAKKQHTHLGRRSMLNVVARVECYHLQNNKKANAKEQHTDFLWRLMLNVVVRENKNKKRHNT